METMLEAYLKKPQKLGSGTRISNAWYVAEVLRGLGEMGTLLVILRASKSPVHL